MPRDKPPPDDGIYRGVILVLVLSIVAGAALALASRFVWHREDLSQLGTWIVLVCGGIYLVFRWLGAREARRRPRADKGADEGADEGAAED